MPDVSRPLTNPKEKRMSMAINTTGSGTVQGFDPSKMASKIASKMMSDLDPDNTGSVSKDKFVSTLTAKGLSSADATKMYDSIDTKKTGSITKSDIESAAKSGSLKPPAGGPKGSGQAPGPGGAGAGAPAGASQASSSSSSKTYEAADTNKDGTVSSAEELLYSLKTGSSASKPATNNLGNNVDTTV
jgi:Ca2+-binding EF-hand superfamily protein